MKKKVIKSILIILLLISIPTFIIIAILYSNDKKLLHDFQNWLSSPGNLSAFIISIGAYFPIVNGIWKMIMNVISSSNSFKKLRKNKSERIKIYDDDKSNYIYYDKKNNIIDFQFKSSEDCDLNKLTDLSIAELKQKNKNFQKKELK